MQQHLGHETRRTPQPTHHHNPEDTTPHRRTDNPAHRDRRPCWSHPQPHPLSPDKRPHAGAPDTGHRPRRGFPGCASCTLEHYVVVPLLLSRRVPSAEVRRYQGRDLQRTPPCSQTIVVVVVNHTIEAAGRPVEYWAAATGRAVSRSNHHPFARLHDWPPAASRPAGLGPAKPGPARIPVPLPAHTAPPSVGPQVTERGGVAH